jgi:hypothetical protein
VFVNYHQDDWVDWLPTAVFAYNTKLNSSLGTSPFFMAKGREPNRGTEPAKKTKVLDTKKFADFMILTRREAQAHLELAKRTMKKFYDKGRQHEEFKEGDTVWLDASDIVTGRPKKKLDWK